MDRTIEGQRSPGLGGPPESGSSTARGRRRGARPGGLALLSLLFLLGSAPAGAIPIDFEDGAVGSDASSRTWEGIASSPALVVDEALVEALTLHEASGTWASSGSQGLLNSLAAEVTFESALAFDSFSLEAVSLLPLAGGSGFQRIAVLLWLGDEFVLGVESDGVSIGDSGLHEAHLEASGFLADRMVVVASTPVSCDLPPCFAPSGDRNAFFLDDVALNAIPEPGVALLVGSGLAVLALRGRRRK